MSADPIGRVNYFDGEALLTKDFQDEQAYHVQMREWLSQGVYTPGVVRGLDVQWSAGDASLTVTSGRALDRYGRLIVLTEDTVYAPTFQDGKQNYLTISFKVDLGDPVSEPYGVGNKRWIEQPIIDCKSEFDPDGDAILLGVISALGGAIQAVYYYFGHYERRRVGAALSGVQFSLEGAPPALLDPYVEGMPTSQAMGISAQRDVDTGAPYLAIDAPIIRLNGNVVADSLDATGSFSGAFNGKFSGDGSLLTLPKSNNYWVLNGSDISYTAGHVAIGDEDASMAHLTIRQRDTPPAVATGLISLEDGGVVTGYQTRFTTELKVGQVISYDFIPPQTATIVSVLSNTQVVIDHRLPIDVGPASFSTQHNGVVTSGGAAKVTAEGTALTCTGGTFPSGLVAGDQIILVQSDEDKPKQLRVLSISDDTHMTVVDMNPTATATGGPKLSAFSVVHSVLLVAGGANPVDTALPPAIVALQNGTGGQVPNSVGINVETGALDGRYALDVHGAIKATRWPATATDSALMMTVGSTTASPYQGLSVVDNGASAAVPKTVAINVDRVDSTYALDVNGPFRATTLAVSSGGFDIGTLKASTEIDADKIGPYTANGSIEVTSDVTFDKTIKGSGANPLTVAGDLEVKQKATIDGSLTVGGSVTVTGDISGKLHNPIPGPLNVDGVFSVQAGNNNILTAGGNNVTVAVDLFAQGNLNVTGALTTDAVTVAKTNSQGVHVFKVSDDGDLSMMGGLTIGANGANNLMISSGGDVNANVGNVTISHGAFSVGGSLKVARDGSVNLFGTVQSWTCKGVKTGANPFVPDVTAQTDGFLMVYINPDSVDWNTSVQVSITVRPPRGSQYQVGAAAILGQLQGRGCSSATVPIQNGSRVSFTFTANSNSSGGADISIYWTPFGSGNLDGMHDIS
jgi:hypothetical protein